MTTKQKTTSASDATPKSAESDTIVFQAPQSKSISSANVAKTKRSFFKRVKRLRKAREQLNRRERASDKNIGLLLRSEGVLESIKKGCEIKRSVGVNLAKKTGFNSVKELNNYISANRRKFIVLADKKICEQSCEKDKCESCASLPRCDSVDLNLFFSHHYGKSI